jgi:DNA modification methylase
MKIKNTDINDIKPYDKNPRNNANSIDKVADSIAEFGFRQPIVVDEDMIVLAGHTRLLASKQLGLKKVPVHIAEGLTNAQKKAYRIMDNKSSEDSEWDQELLNLEIKDLIEDNYDLNMTGFTPEQIDALSVLTESILEGKTDEDSIPEPPKEPKSKLGDIYELGHHRLMCGDSISINDVDKLMDGKKADMVFTDPPYGIDYQDIKKNHKKIAGDESLSNVKDLLSLILVLDIPMYLCCNWKCFSAFEEAMHEAGKYPKSCIVWDKKVRVQNLDKFYKRHEFILYHGEFGGQKTLDGDVWICDREVRKDHPTAKPVELCERAIRYSSENADIVLDLFGGSGATLIAAEKSARKCYMMELDPIYVDVIVKRWEDFTGKKAKLING